MTYERESSRHHRRRRLAEPDDADDEYSDVYEEDRDSWDLQTVAERGRVNRRYGRETMPVSPSPWYGEPGPAAGERSRRRGPLDRATTVLTLLLLVAMGLQTFLLMNIGERISVTERNVASANADDRSRLKAIQDQVTNLESRAGAIEGRSMDPQAVAKDVLTSVFLVQAGENVGTAFALGQDDSGGTNLITNYHVVGDLYADGGRSTSLVRGDTRFTASITKVDPDADLALLRADQDLPGLTPASVKAEPGQPVVVVGAPLGLESTVTAGIVSALRDDPADGPLLQFDAAASPGNSGGPVINAQREVVGVTVSGISGDRVQSINFAIPISVVCESLSIC
jgi:S1-C subfamily serine protease